MQVRKSRFHPDFAQGQGVEVRGDETVQKYGEIARM